MKVIVSGCVVFALLLAVSQAGIPAGGASPTAKLGVGSGTTTPFVLERAAPASSIKVTSPGWVDAPNVTLNTTGDWSIYVQTKSPASGTNGYYTTGTVLSIGTASDTLFKDNAHLSITWCAQYFGAWNQGDYTSSFVVTGKDDVGTAVSQRVPPNNETFFGIAGVRPLVGQGNFTDVRSHGLVVQCRSGVVEFWSVDDAGPRIMDSGLIPNSGFKGITDKPLRLGAALLATQPSSNSAATTYWQQPLQCVVINNGGCLTPVQMQRLFRGAHAQDVVTLDAARGDRYYPGAISGGTVTELLSGQAGVISGKVAAAASILPTTVLDDVNVDMNGFGQVLPRDPPPATTTKARFWGTRMGNTTDIRMRVVQWGAPFPTTNASQIIVDWTPVAAGVQNGQTWLGDLPGVPSNFANYDCEVSWKDATGNWNTGKRLYRQWSLGVTVGIAGQSIVQKQRDDSGTARSFSPIVAGYLRANYNINQGSSGYQSNSSTQGWNSRYTPVSPTTTGANFGETRMAERLALLANCPVGIGNFAIGGSPLSTYLGNTDKWARWKLFIQRDRPQIGVWGNGQGDTATSKTQRFADLDTLLAQYDDAVQNAPGGPWNYQFYVYPMNGDWGTNGDGIRSYDMQWALSRAAQGKPVGVVCYTLDESTQDGTHLSDNDAGLGLLGGRMAQTFANAVGLAPFSGLGPSVDPANSSWSASGGITTVNLVVAPNGGGKLVTALGGAPTGFQIKIDSGSYVAPASAKILDPTHIILTAATAAASAVSVTYQAGYPGSVHNGASTTKAQAGTDNAVYDDRGDMTGLLPGYPMPPITQSNPLAVTKAAPGALPAGQIDTDLGGPTPAGSGIYNGGIYALSGGGTDIGGTADQFNYVYQSVTGDATLITRVTGLSGTSMSTSTRAGLQFRDSMAPDAAFVGVHYKPSAAGSGQVDFIYRANMGNPADSLPGASVAVGPLSTSAPVWLRLVKAGTNFTAYYSTSTSASAPTVWNLVNGTTKSVAVAFTNTYYLAGMDVCSHQNGASVTGTFDNFSLVSKVGGMTQTFSQWAVSHQIADAPAAMPLNDGITNLLKFFCHVDPSQPITASDRAALPAASMLSTADSRNYLAVTYRQNLLAANLTSDVQTSLDLQTWNTVTPDIAQQIGTDPNSGDPIIQAQVDVTGSRETFIRLSVTSQ